MKIWLNAPLKDIYIEKKIKKMPNFCFVFPIFSVNIMDGVENWLDKPISFRAHSEYYYNNKQSLTLAVIGILSKF